MIGLIGAVGRVGLFGGPPRAAAAPDFTLSNASVSSGWNPVVVGELIPNAATPPGVYFVLVDEPAGLAVVNG
jgi:hypothetical protein